MKILQINNVYNFGSTGKITHDIHQGLLENGVDSVVYYGRRNKTQDFNVYKICGEVYAKANNAFSRVTGIMYGGCFFSTNRLFSFIKKEKPDIVHLQCLNGYFVNIYRLIEFLKKLEIPTVLTLHAEFMYTANCGHSLECEKWKIGCSNCTKYKKITKSIFFDRTGTSWKKMQRAFEGFSNLAVVSVSPWLLNRAKQSPFFLDKEHFVILNGIDTNIFRPYDRTSIKKKLNINKKKVIFHVTPDFSGNKYHIKGGYYVIEVAKSLLKEDVCIVVAGKYDKSISYPSNMYMLGNVDNQIELAKLYSMADVTLLTSQRETFSMVCAESLCCGTPVVGFKAGAPELISLPEYSAFCEYGNINELISNIKMLWSIEKIQDLVEEANLMYDKNEMIEKYMSLYKNKCLNM